LDFINKKYILNFILTVEDAREVVPFKLLSVWQRQKEEVGGNKIIRKNV